MRRAAEGAGTSPGRARRRRRRSEEEEEQKEEQEDAATARVRALVEFRSIRMDPMLLRMTMTVDGLM